MTRAAPGPSDEERLPLPVHVPLARTNLVLLSVICVPFCLMGFGIMKALIEAGISGEESWWEVAMIFWVGVLFGPGFTVILVLNIARAMHRSALDIDEHGIHHFRGVRKGLLRWEDITWVGGFSQRIGAPSPGSARTDCVVVGVRPTAWARLPFWERWFEAFGVGGVRGPRPMRAIVNSQQAGWAMARIAAIVHQEWVERTGGEAPDVTGDGY